MNTCPKIADYHYPVLDPESEALFQKARALQKQEEAKPFDEHDHKKVIELYTLAINKGHYKAMNNLAILYEVGYFIPEDEDQALALFQKMEKAGVPEGFINMASVHKEGLANILPNNKKYKAYLKKAAEIGHPRSQFLYGHELLYPETIDKGKYWLNCALDQGYADAAFYLADREVVAGRNSEAFQYYRKGAMLGSNMCLSEMSDIYFYGLHGIEKDKNRGICLEKLEQKLDQDPSLTFPDLDDLCSPSQ